MVRHGGTTALACASLVIGFSALGPQPGATADATTATLGTSAATAAGSCWEIKQTNPSATDGAYWLLTPKMVEPSQFYCDMTTDGGGWVLIGKGREGWTNEYQGKGLESDLLTPTLTTMSSATTQLSSERVDELLGGGRVDALTDGIRLRRAMDANGTSWQEARFRLANRDRWAWTFGAQHPLSSYSFGSDNGSGGITSSFGLDNRYRRVVNTTSSSQTYKLGFAYGSQVTGTTSSTTYLWSATNGLGGAFPYTQAYLRPKVLSTDSGFTTIPDSGVGADLNVSVARNNALTSPWGVTGLAGSTSLEGSVEVQAFTQSGSRMYVGGNFAYVQKDADGTGRVSQPFLAAFDVNTGEWDPGFRPVLNEQVRALATLPDGSVVAGGDFTKANGASAPALVALDPATGATLPGWNVVPENRGANATLRVRALQVADGYLYIGGNLTHLTGGTRKAAVADKNLGRISATTYTPTTNWNPNLNGGVVGIDVSADGSRIYATGHFTKANGATAVSAAAISTAAGAGLVAPAWSPTWSSDNKNYQQAVDEVGDRVWVGGSEHSLFSFSTSDFTRKSGNIFQAKGDVQSITDSNGVIYAGCHCNNFNYSNAFKWNSDGSVAAGWTQADAINWFGAWDAATGKVIPQFTPSFTMRLGSGIWAIQADSSGTVWAGGDVKTVRTANKAAAWSGGFARFAPTDTTPPEVPTGLKATSFTSSQVTLSWSSSAGSAAHYVVLRDDRPVAVTSTTSVTVPRGGSDRYFVRSVDTAGNASASTSVLNLPTTQPPVAAFTAQVSGASASFDASTSSDPDGTVTGYAWDFGDSSTGAGVKPNHVYQAPGTYDVTLTVTDNSGARASVTHQVEVASSASASVVVPRLSQWRWYYGSTAPATGWQGNAFDESAWSTGNAVLGFGSATVATNIDTFATTADRPRAAYFRKTFQVADSSKVVKLVLSSVANDGAVVYVNGQEVGRQNMPSGAISFTTYASSARSVATANATPFVIEVPASALVNGTNTIAVETHLNFRATTDVSFDLDATLYTTS